MPEQRKSPWSQGYDAGLDAALGRANPRNPFTANTPDHTLWAIGYADAMEDEFWPDDA